MIDHEPTVFRRRGRSWSAALLARRDDWGIESLDLANPPRRIWADMVPAPPIVEIGVDSREVDPVPSPAHILELGPPDSEGWTRQSRRSLARLFVQFLLAEDPQRRLDVRKVETLAHQVSLVRHILDSDALRQVLIADEVGLGKTVEAGLLLAEFLQARPGLRVLYLAPARLVRNVRNELERLDLPFRQWTAADADARLSDPLIIASIHRAVMGKNLETFLEAPPWDVLIVDECHHLSAWEPGGGDPRRAYRLVKGLVERQGPDARVIFLSGTPHQGSPVRFENLLSLLVKKGEARDAMNGRVILRTKEDVRDWEGRPLFPQREVRPPTVVDLGPDYRAWIDAIHGYFSPDSEDRGPDAKRRAVGWRCAQALQWAASSVQAGIGYLIRQALRGRWAIDDPILLEAASALRPYRRGPRDEEPASLLRRMLAEIQRQSEEGDVEDIEELDYDEAVSRKPELAFLIRSGLSLLGSQETKWDVLDSKILREAGEEKVVLFAQPIETVGALAEVLERRHGVRPSVIVGGQSDDERDGELQKFREPDGPRFLVSSRAGGEGINLQVARRLVHVDVPWNPMELEQRVGRVHRFGSRKTILVDTLVVKDSREEHAYAVARNKLEHIAKVLGGNERFESLFSRVMALVPPEDLQNVLIRAPLGPMDLQDQDALAGMVQAGFERWREFHERFGRSQKEIRDQNPGLATWEDVRRFALKFADAEELAGYQKQSFRFGPGGVESQEEPATAIRFRATNAVFTIGVGTAAPTFDASGRVIPAGGLNTPEIATALREYGLDSTSTGAAHLRASRSERPPLLPSAGSLGVLVLLRQALQVEGSTSWGERGGTLHAFLVEASGRCREVPSQQRAELARWLLDLTVRTTGPEDSTLSAALKRAEANLIAANRRPTEADRDAGLRFAVWPILAAIVTT